MGSERGKQISDRDTTRAQRSRVASICPGMHFANQELFIAIAMMLWSFDIRPLVDEKGEAILPPRDQWVDDAIVV